MVQQKPQSADSSLEAYRHLPIPLAVCRLSPKGFEILAVSDGLCGLLGQSSESILKNPASCIHPDDLHELRALVAGDVFPIRLKTPGGYLSYIVSMTENDGLVFLSLIKNITDSAEIRHYEQQISLLKHNIDAGMLVKCLCNITQNRVTEYTCLKENAFTYKAGGDYDTLRTCLLASAIDEEERKRLETILNKDHLISGFQEGETHFEYEFCQAKEGLLPSWASIVLSTFMNPTTADLECCLFVYDVTDKTLSKQILSHLQLLGFDVIGLLYVKSGDCRYFRIKKMHPDSLYEHLEDFETSIFGDIQRIIAPEDWETVHDGLKITTLVENLSKMEVYAFRYSMTNRDGKKLEKLFQFSYLDKKKDTIFFCKSDITKQYEDEQHQIEELKKAKLAADNANEAKSLFLSSMSHDLRTPLGGIIGFTDLAIKTNDASQKQQYLLRIKSSGGLLLDLVNDTLELSRIDSGKMVIKPEVTDIKELADTVVTALNQGAELKHITLKCTYEGPIHQKVWADKLKVQKVILNLLSNAIKYTPMGGEVQFFVEKQVKGIMIIVSDNGIGMKPEFMKILYQPFSQENRPEAGNVIGTGLGLAIVKKIIDAMNGTIQVESTVDKGTRFTVMLPLWDADLQIDEARKGTDIKGKRLLLCEDNYLNREIATTILSARGVLVDCAQNGQEGVNLYSISQPSYYAAILMDIRMPVMDGYDAVKAIRGLKRNDAKTIPIIALSGDAFEEEIQHEKEAGMNAHLTKPLDPQKLFDLLSTLIAD